VRGADAIAAILKAEGVEQVFCFPFSPILDALARAGIRPIVSRQERVAENMADGYSRTSDGERLGVVTVQQSAGVENGFAGIAQAFTDSSPILFLPGHPGTRLTGMHPSFDASRNYAATTKWADLIPSTDAIASRMRRAFVALRSGRPRPVLLEVPVDIAAAELDGFEYTPVRRVRSAGDPEAVSAALDLLLAAKRPLVWAGQGVLYARASAELAELAERLALPVMTTLLGKSGFDESHPLSLGTGGYAMTAMVADALEASDVVFALGASLGRDFTAPPIPAGKRFIHNTVDASDLHVYYPAEVALLGDARLVLRQLLDELRARRVAAHDRAPIESHIARLKAAWRERWAPKLASDEVPINPYRVIGDFRKTFDPAHTIVTHDSGNPRDQLVPQYEAVTPRGYLGWGHSTQLGFGLGAAMGAKLAAPEKIVANFMGDAAFGMVGMDVETAVRERIPILTVLLNNSAMGNYEKNIPDAAERYGTKYLSGNYSEVARGLGAYTERIEQPRDIVPAFLRARAELDAGHPVVLEVITREEGDIPYWHTYRR
jgi:acetolactate synthase-1/2/3 large subunit